jgi:membrane-associated protein
MESTDDMISLFGVWTYVILFVNIFCETGLVVTPFLPGDSLLFAAGAFAAHNPHKLSIWAMLVVLSGAAILGDTLNYGFGAWVGPRAFSGRIRFLKQEHLWKTEAFYEKYGAKAIVLARFVPIVRTFIPFVAGIGAMNYRRFVAYNIVGGIAWVGLCGGFGFWFGNIPWIKRHFEAVIVAVVLLSVVPVAWEYYASRRWPPPKIPPGGETSAS